MTRIYSFSWMLWLALPGAVIAQPAQVREVAIHTQENSTHQYLQIHVPAGELFLRQSMKCGMSHTKIQASDTSAKWIIREAGVSNGNMMREAVVHTSSVAQAANSRHHADLRQNYRVDPIASDQEASAIRSEFSVDPSLSTDLNIYLGRGSSWLDLSNLSLNNVSIESSFSDLVISYSRANQTPMQKMHVHVANANVVLKHLEYARASVIHVQNDMGDTKLMLGNRLPHEKETPLIELRNGVGDCLIVIDQDRPVRIAVNKGVLASADADTDSGFIRMDNRDMLTYQNKIAEGLPDQQVTLIHCDLDFGELILLSR